MKSASKKRAPTIVNLTVKRRYLTEREVERLMDCAGKHGRYGHRDATMILVAYRHGLRASIAAGARLTKSRPAWACANAGRSHRHRRPETHRGWPPWRSERRGGRWSANNRRGF